MTKRRMHPIEKLARDICWAGFTTKQNVTKAEYWEKVALFQKESYVAEARHLVWITRKLGLDRLRSALETIKE